DVSIAVTQLPAGPQATVEWCAATIVDYRPGLLPLFEDDRDFALQLSQGGGAAEVVTGAAFSGTSELRILPKERSNPNLPNLQASIRETPLLGEYRYLRFAWKKTGGSRICLQL